MSRFTRRSLLKTAGGAAATLPLMSTSILAQDPVRAGFVYVGPIGDFGWSWAHNHSREIMQDHFGDAVVSTYVENVAEGPDAERVIRRMAQEGNDIIFTTSFGFMDPTLAVASRFPDTKFEHATGFQTAPNMSIYNARFYEGRAICGTIAGHMSQNGVAGYIASFPIPEVVMGINAFLLAARKVNPDFELKVVWVNTWFDPAKEADAARALIDQGADIITQHTDSPAALQVCEQRGIPAFGQASDMSAFAPEAHLTAILDDWAPYYIQRVQAVIDGTWEMSDTWWGMQEGMVAMSPYSDRIPAEALAAAQAVEAGILDGSLHPFEGPVYDQAGTLRIAEGEVPEDGVLLSMDWYVPGVTGV